MVKQRTVVVIGLLTTIVCTSILLRTDIFSTAHAPSRIESEYTQMPIDETVVTPTPEPVFDEVDPISVAPIVPTEPTQRCYVSGCSSQLCGSEEGMMSICEYREEYACYQTATCEVQPTGECGWTETEELNSCLLNASASGGVSSELAI